LKVVCRIRLAEGITRGPQGLFFFSVAEGTVYGVPVEGGGLVTTSGVVGACGGWSWSYRQRLGGLCEHHNTGWMQVDEEEVVTLGIVLITVGLAGILYGFLAHEFYPAFIRRPGPSEKSMPKWLGRTIFFGVGVWFIYSGISHLSRH
jgi:hypothetical protein